MRVAKQACARLTIRGIRQPGVRIGVVAEGRHVPLTKEASTARNGEWDHNAVAIPEVLYIQTNFHNLPHELVAEHITGFHCRNHAVVEV